jgi:hypothetical protein
MTGPYEPSPMIAFLGAMLFFAGGLTSGWGLCAGHSSFHIIGWVAGVIGGVVSILWLMPFLSTIFPLY